jgi:hypothetical protein
MFSFCLCVINFSVITVLFFPSFALVPFALAFFILFFLSSSFRYLLVYFSHILFRSILFYSVLFYSMLNFMCLLPFSLFSFIFSIYFFTIFFFPRFHHHNHQLKGLGLLTSFDFYVRRIDPSISLVANSLILSLSLDPDRFRGI